MIRRRIEAETPDMLNDLLAEIDAGTAGIADDAGTGTNVGENVSLNAADTVSTVDETVSLNTADDFVSNVFPEMPDKDETIPEAGRRNAGSIRENAAKKKPGRSVIVRFAAAAAALLLTFSVGWYIGNTAGLNSGINKVTPGMQSEQSGQQQELTGGLADREQSGQAGQTDQARQSGQNMSGQSDGQNVTGAQAVLAAVTLDVNPSVRMEIGNDKRVISCVGLNEEGKDIVSMMDLTGSDITVASYAVVGGMLSNGYLTDISNSVLVSVESDQKEEGVAIESALSESLKNYLENSSIGAAIVGQYVQADDNLRQFAADNQISEGKAWIIKNLVSANERLSEDSLLKLSTQELLLLWTSQINGAESNTEQNVKDAQAGNDGSQSENDVSTGSETRKEEEKTGTTIFGTVSEKKYIGRDQALDAACRHVGIEQSQAEAAKVEFYCDDGIIIYEVEFINSGRTYEIDVQADDGTILESDTEVIRTAAGTSGVDFDDDDADDRDDDDRYEIDDDDDRSENDDDDRYEADDDDDDGDDDDD